MNSSGIKRGLAGSAITALAITGLPFLATSANADSLAAQQGAGDGVTLVTPESIASVENDGSESTVHLVANGGSDVQQVRFEFSTNGGTSFTPIATVSRNAGGAFSTEWAPIPATFNQTVEVRAVALGSVGTEIGTPDSNSVLVDADADAIDIAYAPGAQVGVFDQPYSNDGAEALLGAVSGTTSDLAGDPDLDFSAYTSNGVVTQEDVAGEVETGDTSRSYSAPVDFTGYPLDTTAPRVNEAIILAQAEAEDAEPVNLYTQTISGVTVEADNANVQGANTTDITVTVTDQNGNPVVGAQVFGEDGVTVGQSPRYTNSQGEAVFTGATGTANGTTYDFYVNTTEVNAYENGVDFRRSVTVGSYTATPTTITASSADGDAFDFQENDGDDLRVRVLDQNGNPVSGQNVSYSLSVDLFPPAAGAPTPNPAPTTGTATTGPQGYANIPFTNKGEGEYTLSAYVNQDGTPGQGPGDLSAADLEFKAGEANLVFADADDNAAGTTATYSASLTLDDGTALPGRLVRFTYDAGTGPDADDVVVAAQGNQPAGTTRISNTVAEDTTNADGEVQVALSDPANTPSRSELDGELDAMTAANAIGNANADADAIDVNFVTSDVDGTAVVDIDANNATGTPGEVTMGSVNVTVDDPDTTAVETDPAANVLVTLTVDGDAFFTTAAGEPANNEDGDLQGDLVERGQSITVVTDNNGDADYYLGIKGSDDFDDDGEAVVDVTATVDGESDTEDYEFSSEDPLNGGEVIIELAADRFQQSSVLPLAPLSDSVAYDVSVTDQFGNPVGGEDVDIDVDGVGTSDDNTVQTDFNDDVEFSVTSGTAGESTPVGTWDAPVNEYGTAGAPSPATTDEIEGEGPTVEFYAVDYAASTFTLAQGGAETQPVGSTVIMTYTAVDQNGEPIELYVDFFRTGPDNQQGGEANSQNVFTGEDGQATYVFAGTAEGTATVTAIASETANGEAIPETQATDTVSFGEDDVPPPPVEAIISASSNGPKKDVVRFQVDDAAEGATVKLFKIRGKKSEGNKRLVQVREDIVPEGGTLTFKVADRNGNKKTRFIAKVSATENSQKAKSNTQKPR